MYTAQGYATKDLFVSGQWSELFEITYKCI